MSLLHQVVVIKIFAFRTVTEQEYVSDKSKVHWFPFDSFTCTIHKNQFKLNRQIFYFATFFVLGGVRVKYNIAEVGFASIIW